MRKTILFVAAAGVALPLAATSANAQYYYPSQDYRDRVEYQREYNDEVAECNRELRRADSRREYYNELAECQRELAEERREYSRDVADNRYSYGSRYGSGYVAPRYGYNSYPGYGYNSYPSYGYNSYGYNTPYYADRYYRSGSYPVRRLGYNDRIYVGSDGRYYCRRSDGTTGLIIGGAVGALIGRSIDRGGSSLLGTLIGGAAGAALGREIQRGSVRCR